MSDKARKKTKIGIPVLTSAEKNQMDLEDPQRDMTYDDILKRMSTATLHLSQTYTPPNIHGRDQQKDDIKKFILQGIQAQGLTQTLYISGAPGIGKTLCVNQVLGQLKKQGKLKKAKLIQVNAISLTKPKQIYKIIYEKLTGKIQKNASNSMYILSQLFHSNRSNLPKPIVLVVDEVDFLLTNDQDVIYNLSEWTQQKNSHLIFVTISNNINFPELLKTKATSRMGHNRIIFKPYSNKQIEKILKERIQPLRVFDESGYIYISMKLAKCTSDIRKSLAVLRNAIWKFQSSIKQPSKAYLPIGVQFLSLAHQQTISIKFTQIFPQFSRAMKIVMIIIAKHFKSENTPLPYHLLHSKCSGFLGDIKNTRPILEQLRDCGIIQISFGATNRDKRIKKQPKMSRQLYQEHISLSMESQSILGMACKEEKVLVPLED